MADLHTAMHHLAHITHAYRGHCSLYESFPQEFTAVCDIPDNQVPNLDDVSPFLSLCRQRLLNTNTNTILECRDYQRLSINNGPPVHRLFLRCKVRDEGR